MNLSNVPTVIAVASGKGGVGKTTVATDIAKKASEMGASVGLVDVDISTPNAPEVVGEGDVDFSDQRLATRDTIVPPEVDGIQLVSKGIVLPDDVPVMRDGEWRAQTVIDYVTSVDWSDDTDIVIIDTPPGTGEELQVVMSEVRIDTAFAVTTPHPSSIRDVTKTHEFFKQAEVDHEAIINMAYIPGVDVASHVIESLDLSDVNGVGDAKEAAIGEVMAEGTPDYPLFGYSGDVDLPFPVEVAATVPYTTDGDARREVYGSLLGEYIAETQEVEP